MSTEENKALVRRAFELLELDQALPEELLGPGFTYGVAGSPPKDLEATRHLPGHPPYASS